KIEAAERAHKARMEDIEREHAHRVSEIRRQVREEYVNASLALLDQIGSATQHLYDAWYDQRSAQLEREGVSEEKRNEILEREGRKRFEFLKKVLLAQAVANGIASVVSSYREGAAIGGPVLGGIYAAAAALATGIEIDRLRR